MTLISRCDQKYDGTLIIFDTTQIQVQYKVEMANVKGQTATMCATYIKINNCSNKISCKIMFVQLHNTILQYVASVGSGKQHLISAN